MVQFKFCFILTGCFFVNICYSQKKLELQTNRIAQLVCNEEQHPTIEDFLQKGIYSAGLKASVFASETPVNFQDIQPFLKGQLKRNKHLGYDWGQCKGNKFYIVTTPAEASLKMHAEGSWHLPLAALRKHCHKSSLDFASMSTPSVKKIDISVDGYLTHQSSEQGVYSLTCWPKKPKWMGPRVWYLIPTSDLTLMQTPHSRALDARETDPNNFIVWLNMIRRQSGLIPVVREPVHLDQYARILGSSGHIHHDHDLLDSLAQKAKSKEMSLLGENRVMGATNQALAKLLWISPRHRRLLLNPKAARVGIHLQKVKSQVLMIVVFAEQNKSQLSLKQKANL